MRHALAQYALCERVINAQGLVFETKFACVAGHASGIKVPHIATLVLMVGETYWQIAQDLPGTQNVPGAQVRSANCNVDL
jgi:hypothetical protein